MIYTVYTTSMKKEQSRHVTHNSSKQNPFFVKLFIVYDVLRSWSEIFIWPCQRFCRIMHSCINFASLIYHLTIFSQVLDINCYTLFRAKKLRWLHLLTSCAPLNSRQRQLSYPTYRPKRSLLLVYLRLQTQGRRSFLMLAHLMSFYISKGTKFNFLNLLYPI